MPLDPTAFERAFRPLAERVTTPGGTYSGSAMAAELEALRPRARALGEDSPQHAELLSVLALVRSRRGEEEEALALGEASLGIQARTAPLPEAYLLRHLVAQAAGALGRHPEAAAHLEALLLDPAAELSTSQRLGVRQDVGFHLHEAGRFGAALERNLALLADAEGALGPEAAALRGLLCNLAQNLHALGRPDEARAFLRRRLALADRHGEEEVALDSLFQLGVLAFECGRPEEARGLFEEELARARRSGDPGLLEAALAHQEELARRRGGA